MTSNIYIYIHICTYLNCLYISVDLSIDLTILILRSISYQFTLFQQGRVSNFSHYLQNLLLCVIWIIAITTTIRCFHYYSYLHYPIWNNNFLLHLIVTYLSSWYSTYLDSLFFKRVHHLLNVYRFNDSLLKNKTWLYAVLNLIIFIFPLNTECFSRCNLAMTGLLHR